MSMLLFQVVLLLLGLTGAVEYEVSCVRTPPFPLCYLLAVPEERWSSPPFAAAIVMILSLPGLIPPEV